MLSFYNFQQSRVDMTPTQYNSVYGDGIVTYSPKLLKVSVYGDGLYIEEHVNGIYYLDIDRSRYKCSTLIQAEKLLFKYYKEETK